ncbi:MAG: 1-acyl-sn-glycerol-3-phosphate acyltransferase [Acidobacteriota bacterium]|jgi:1-acyl-sn-glycerol-3-phosphate acyltransferase|nr:1-acyl-sn-glycerol-3-phosphate acyltransferase [Acidobacteriota bacterium]
MKKPALPLTVLATFTGNLFLVLGSFVLSILATLVSWIPPRGNWTFGVARIWSRCLLTASAVRVEARYDPAIEPGRSYVFLCNHQSLFDIPALLATCPGQVRMMAKRSLFRVPFFGWGLWAGGFIPIDRGDRSTARQSFASAIARLRAGTSILLFPEGTRSTTGTLLPFERGGILLAIKMGLPIVPVGVRGTREVQPKGSVTIRPGKVEVGYGAPISCAEYGIRRRAELTTEVRRRVAELAGLALPEGES